MVFPAKKSREEERNPFLGNFDQREEFLKVFRTNRKHTHALLLDLDGTIIRFYRGKAPHRQLEIRPHFAEFIEAAGKIADVFVFSATHPSRLQNVVQQYFKGLFKGLFDSRFLSRRRKSTEHLADECPDVLLVDDTPRKVHMWSQKRLVKIDRWLGDPEDDELLRVLKEIHYRWGLTA